MREVEKYYFTINIKHEERKTLNFSSNHAPVKIYISWEFDHFLIRDSNQ